MDLTLLRKTGFINFAIMVSILPLSEPECIVQCYQGIERSFPMVNNMFAVIEIGCFIYSQF